MTAELADIRGFVAAHHPFDLLPEAALAEVAKSIEISYARRDTVIMKPGDKVASLYMVRTGAVETRDPDGQLLARVTEGEVFGVRSLLRGGQAVNQIVAIEDSLVYQVPAALFHKLRDDHPPFAYFFASFDGGRLRDSFGGGMASKNFDLLTKRAGALLARGPVTVGPEASIQQAAQVMRQERVSSVLVVEDGRLTGILTDRDLRSRVVAEGLPVDRPVRGIMSPATYVVQAGDQAFEALLLMSRHNIHHLPVLDDGKVAGCLTTSMLVQSHSTSPLYMARNIHDCTTVEQLRDIVARIPNLVLEMAEWGATAQSIGHTCSTLTDAVTVRLIQLAEEKLGPPPVPYAWMAAGSQARHEQTALSDQDNCLILSDDYDPLAHGPYFASLAKLVCDGLNSCGYVYCPGEMMAMTDQWRMTLGEWKRTFTRWIEEPEPKALMLSCVFFDMRVVHGEARLYQDLHEMILEKSQKNRIFLAYMAKNAMSHQPPLGFFRNLVLIHRGDHDHTLDLKHNGVVPIVDLARVYALSAGVGAVNSFDRLSAAAQAGALSQEGGLDLTDALEFISLTRLQHQSRMIREGQKADNYLSPDELSSFERSHLKGAFSVVKTLQTSMARAFQLDRF